MTLYAYVLFYSYIFYGADQGTFTTRRWYVGLVARLLRRQPTINASLMVEQLHGQSSICCSKRWTTPRPGLCAGHDHSNQQRNGRTSATSARTASLSLSTSGTAKTHHVVLARKTNGEVGPGGSLFDQASRATSEQTVAKYTGPAKAAPGRPHGGSGDMEKAAH